MSDKALLKYSELAELTSLAEVTLRRWVSHQRIPFTKLGRSVRFTTEQVNDIITNGPAPEQSTRQQVVVR